MTTATGDIQAGLEASDAVVAWCLRGAVRSERSGDLERAAVWAYIAAGVATDYGHGYLCSPELEALLLRLGGRLKPATATVAVPAAGGSRNRRRWLHVFSMTFGIGGHTALARRWIAHDPSDDRHDVVLTTQHGEEVAHGLAVAAREKGGRVTSLFGEPGMLRRAQMLRELAAREIDVVVLHAHPWDVVPLLAFASPGGPPVLLLNHADHAFWVGRCVADAVVEIRDSGRHLSQVYRAVHCSLDLPVPLDDRGPAPRDRSLAAARLHDPSLLGRDTVLLTIGSGQKYRAAPGLNLPSTLMQIMESLPNCALIAVGPDRDDPLWRDLNARSGGRIAAVGTDPDLAPWHAAADLYLEGFPVGTYTALLEVALAERAFVRKPWLAPPAHLPIDAGALAAFEPPPDPDAYLAQVRALCEDPRRRESMASTARSSVQGIHCGRNWARALERLATAVPGRHEPETGLDVPPLSPALKAYWAGYHAASHRREDPFAFARGVAASYGLMPRTDVELLDALRRTQH